MLNITQDGVSRVPSIHKEKILSTVVINGVTIQGGNNVSIVNGKVVIDGKDATPDAKEISIVVNGAVNRLEADACNTISVTGDVGNIKTLSGDVDVSGDVSGSVQTMSGDVSCGSIAGSASSMSGDIKQRR